MTQQGLYTEDDISNADINGLGLCLEKIKTSTENENCLIFLCFQASGYFYLSYPCNKVGEGQVHWNHHVYPSVLLSGFVHIF